MGCGCRNNHFCRALHSASVTLATPVVDPRERDRIRSVDGLRALAFLLVFLFHSWEFSGRPDIPVVTDVVGSNTRPDLFIVLTGFALFLPFARDWGRVERFRSGTYLVRRLRRIVLPYWVALAVALLIPVVLKALMSVLGVSTNATEPPEPLDVLTHLTFTHMFFPEYWDGINGSLWTMSLEMQLYVIFPLLVWIVARWGLAGLVPVILLSIAYRMLVGQLVDGPAFPDHFLWGATALGRLMEFIAGMVAAVMAMNTRGKFRVWHGVACVVLFFGGYLLATATPWSASVAFPVRELALAVAFGALIVLAINNSKVERAFAWRPMSRLGYMAYSMFLIHQPIIYYFGEMLKEILRMPEGLLMLSLMWTVGFAVVYAFGWVFFRVVEKPCIAWSRAAAR